MIRPGIATACLVLLISAALAAPGGTPDDCPSAVRKTIAAEAGGTPVATVHKETNADKTLYWAELLLDGRKYAITVHEDGTLDELSLTYDDHAIPFEQCPGAVRATLLMESLGEPLNRVAVGKRMKYGVTIYEVGVTNEGKSYEILVAEDGTLVEKVMLIEDQSVKLGDCPEPVQASIKAHAQGGVIVKVLHSTGILRPTYEAQLRIDGKRYYVEVGEDGRLIAKSHEPESL